MKCFPLIRINQNVEIMNFCSLLLKMSLETTHSHKRFGFLSKCIFQLECVKTSLLVLALFGGGLQMLSINLHDCIR